MFFNNSKKSEILSDEDLAAAYRESGDMDILGKLYASYLQLVFAVCYKYLKNQEESQDAVMQIFEHLVVKLKTQSIENFRPWLHSVARNYCLMKLRSGKSNVFENLDQLNMESSGHEHLIDNDIEINAHLPKLDKCLETLNSEQKLTIKLFYLEEKCYQEIAESTGYELNKVKSYIQNGKRNLKICIEKKDE